MNADLDKEDLAFLLSVKAGLEAEAAPTATQLEAIRLAALREHPVLPARGRFTRLVLRIAALLTVVAGTSLLFLRTGRSVDSSACVTLQTIELLGAVDEDDAEAEVAGDETLSASERLLAWQDAPYEAIAKANQNLVESSTETLQ